jgi:hypothetical protein
MPTTTRSQRRRQPVRSPQPQQPRRHTAHPTRVIEAPDYSRDYADVRRDLTMITIISIVLFVGMVALSFVL